MSVLALRVTMEDVVTTMSITILARVLITTLVQDVSVVRHFSFMFTCIYSLDCHSYLEDMNFDLELDTTCPVWMQDLGD